LNFVLIWNKEYFNSTFYLKNTTEIKRENGQVISGLVIQGNAYLR